MFRRRLKKKEAPQFPKNIEGFGYNVNEKGEIRGIENGTFFLSVFFKERKRKLNKLYVILFINRRILQL